MSFVLLGILNAQAAGGGGAAYYIAALGGTGGDQAYGVTTDSANNAYVFGDTTSAGQGQSDFLLVKYANTGTVEWQRILGDTNFEQGRAATIDSADNVLVFGHSYSTGSGAEFQLAKYDDSGSIQWQRALKGGQNEFGNGVAVDSGNNVYVTGRTSTPSGTGKYDMALAKYNSSGTLQWQRTLGGVEDEDSAAIAIDSSDNIYVAGQQESDTVQPSRADCLIAKYNSSGTVQWQRSLGGTSSDFLFGITTDSAGNVYSCGMGASASGGAQNTPIINKYDSSGNLQWQRYFNNGGEFRGIASDSSNNVYAIGKTSADGAGSDDFLIAKYDSSGTLQWQRTLGGTSFDLGKAVYVDSNDDLYVTGWGRFLGDLGGEAFFTAKLPNDGSLTGTYLLRDVNITYEASTLTDAASSLTAFTVSLTSATSSLTSATTTLTDSSSSLTDYVTEIG